MQFRLFRSDVLVLGSGGAGLQAALAAHGKKADVLVLGKCKKGEAHTVLATGGINAALGTMDSEDSWQQHWLDTYLEGRMLADPGEVEVLCRKAAGAIQELVQLGVKFHREKDGRLTQRFFGAHTWRRTCFVGDRTGKAIEEALVKEVKRQGIPFLENVYITRLLAHQGKVNGAFGFDLDTGELLAFHAKAVVLATGGYSRVYRRSSSRIFENTGDGLSLAWPLGGKLEDMEMVQFHPTGMLWPREAEGVLVTEAVRGEGGVLLNAKGERFMHHYHVRGELGPRDVVARAIYSEIMAGRGTMRGGVWLDISHLPKSYILERLPKMYRQYKDYCDVDISKEKMEVAPTAHYSMGGLRVERKTGRVVGVKGLFAVGEVTSGVHGANRLGGNSLLEILVFGKLAGERAAGEAKTPGFSSLQENQVKHAALALQVLVKKKGKHSPLSVRADIQELMWEHAGIVRRKGLLERGLRKLELLKHKTENLKVGGKALGKNPALATALDVQNLLLPAEAVLRSALARTESRGAQFRSEFPKEKPGWRCNLVCTRSGDGMMLGKRQALRPRKGLSSLLQGVPRIREKAGKLLE